MVFRHAEIITVQGLWWSSKGRYFTGIIWAPLIFELLNCYQFGWLPTLAYPFSAPLARSHSARMEGYRKVNCKVVWLMLIKYNSSIDVRDERYSEFYEHFTLWKRFKKTFHFDDFLLWVNKTDIFQCYLIQDIMPTN